ncbi:hypothetical protein CDAR_501821 [Caerostris darwini]|uniref:Uncharacterized protein n=1 Tax=Caerostris darwini TaxID=1538125 RepID=A0AAV4TPB3_9ARAC|nr:hypothetical protein CDAR_501821 [Caerostris darwini]
MQPLSKIPQGTKVFFNRSRLPESEHHYENVLGLITTWTFAAENLSGITGIFQILTFWKTTKRGVGECNYETEAEAGKGGSVSEVRRKERRQNRVGRD